MDSRQVKNSGILVFSNLAINLAGFLRQVLMAWVLGLSAQIDMLLLAMIVPAIIQAMIGGGAGEIMVIRRDRRPWKKGSFETLYILLCLLPVALLGILYYLSLPLLMPLFGIDHESTRLFTAFSILFIVNMLPGTFNSVLRPHLYSGGHYGFYAVSATASQFAGLLFILLTVRQMGIYAFAWSHLIASSLNAVWFSFRSGLCLSCIFRPAVWRHEAAQLIILMKRVVSLSVQTLLNHFATFWERSLSVRFLSPGYLSSLNYSKTLTDLPGTVLLSSVLTTSYIEQTRLHKDDYPGFERYTVRVLRLLLGAGLLFQALMLLLAPALIILVYRRGRFDNDAVYSTLIIFNILTAGFMPQLVMNFLTRTMYIVGEYRRLLLTVLLKVCVQAGLMVSLIRAGSQTIPFAIVTGFVITAFLLWLLMRRHISLPQPGRFVIMVAAAALMAAALMLLHSHTIHLYIGRSNTAILLMSLPLMLAAAVITLIFLVKNGVRLPLPGKIADRLWKN